MSTMSSFELDHAISGRFSMGMEDHAVITDAGDEEIIINSDASLDGDIEELNDHVQIVAETDNNMTRVDEATTTLESLVVAMESSLLIGGFDKRSARLANISLESIATRFDMDTTVLSFGMEAVEDDAEGETQSALGRAKQMLSALKSGTGALLNKMYVACAAALGNTAAISQKLIQKAAQLRGSIVKENKGGNAIRVSKGVKSKLTLDGHTPLDPNAYLGELKRLTDKYNEVVKVYADTDMLSKFVGDVMKGVAGQEGEPASKKDVLRAVASLKSDITTDTKAPEGMEIKTSKPYLGGARITAKRPSKVEVEKMLKGLAQKSQKQVSQEADIGHAALGVAQIVAGGMLWALGGIVSVVGVMDIAGGVAVAAFGVMTGGLGLIGAGLLASGWGFLWYTIGAYGMKKAGEVIEGGKDKIADGVSGEVASKGQPRVHEAAHTAAEVMTEFDVVGGTGVSLEDDTASSVKSLSAQQIDHVANIVISTSATTKNMNALLAKRKAVMGDVDKIAKAMTAETKESKGANVAMTNASRAFVKQFIKQTIKFEMEFTAYSVGVMKAALAYAEASNKA